ncbi:MAG TPA: hypothetical protein VLR49_06920 [Ferruginibacter sp.]|nr:hypothetical protein [Ferruginibacter sp.]
MSQEQIIIASVVSNMVALLLLFLSWKRKNIARILFAILFTWAAVVNWTTAHNNPLVYLEYGKYAINIYSEIIYGAFSKHITGYISFIAAGQLLIALGFLARGIIVKISCVGGIIFLMAIAPLGTGSAFPFSIIASIALYLLYKYHFTKDIFKNKWWI